MKFIRHLLAAAIGAAATASVAQNAAVSVGSLTHDTSLPVEVTSDNLSVSNESGEAIFDGNVVVIQGPMRLAAAKIVVDYEEVADGGTEIREMVASGGVTFVNGEDAAESQDAVYSPEAGTLVMTGEVLLTQNDTAISGQHLTIDLAAGTGVMEGRVRTTFQTGGN